MLASVTLELQSPDTWWDDLVQSVSSLPFHYCSFGELISCTTVSEVYLLTAQALSS